MFHYIKADEWTGGSACKRGVKTLLTSLVGTFHFKEMHLLARAWVSVPKERQ